MASLNHLIRTSILLAALGSSATVHATADAVDPQSGNASPTAPAVAAKGYQLVFSDEFNGTTVDTDKWAYRTDKKSWSTQRAANVDESDGCLHIHVSREADGTHTGGGVISTQKRLYGYYEARLRVPPGSGWHTAFWMMPYNGKDTIPRQKGQELDICEIDSENLHSYNAGIHGWGKYARPGQDYSLARHDEAMPDESAAFHVWGCEFTPTTVTFFRDGKKVKTVGATTFPHADANIWLTCIGYDSGHHKKMDDTKLPASADFDYVRFYALPKP